MEDVRVRKVVVVLMLQAETGKIRMNNISDTAFSFMILRKSTVGWRPTSWANVRFPPGFSWDGARNHGKRFLHRGISYATATDIFSLILEESEETFEAFLRDNQIPSNATIVKEAWDIKKQLRKRNADGGRSVSKKEGWRRNAY